MELNSLAGIAGSVLLLCAPARDQYGRFLVFNRSRRAESAKSLGSIWKISARTHERDRNSFSFLDSFTMALGAICIGFSYLL